MKNNVKFDPNTWDKAIEEYNRKLDSNELYTTKEMTEEELRDYDAEYGYFEDEDEDDE